MTKEVKLDAPSALPQPVVPKTVVKKYTIQGPGAEAAAAKLKAQLAAARPGRPLQAGKSQVDPVAVKAAQVLQTQQARNASGVTSASEVSAELGAKGALGKEVSAKIVLPPGMFGKPDPKLLQSAAQKLGTAAARLANTFNDPGQTLEALMESTDFGKHFTDAELAVLLLDAEHTDRLLNEELSSVSSTLDVELATLKVEQTKIDNSFRKIGDMVDFFENIKDGTEALKLGNEQLQSAIIDIREGLAKTSATKAERAVDNNLDAQKKLAGTSPEAQATIAAAAPAVVPAEDVEKLQGAINQASGELAGAQKDKDSRQMDLAREKLATARQSAAAKYAAIASGALTDAKMTPVAARAALRGIINDEEKDLDDPEVKALERGQRRAAIANQLGLLADAQFNDPNAKKDSARTAAELDTHLRQIDQDQGTMAAAQVEAQIAANRAANLQTPDHKPIPGVQQAPHKTLFSTTGNSTKLKELQDALPKLLERRDAAVADYQRVAKDTGFLRLRMNDPPVPDVGALAAATAHSVDVATQLTSATGRAIEKADADIAALALATPSARSDADQARLTALENLRGKLASSRAQEKDFASRTATALYGSDDENKGHTAGEIEKLTTQLSQKNITGAEFSKGVSTVVPALTSFNTAVASGSGIEPAMRQVDGALGGVRDTYEHAELAVEMKNRTEAAAKKPAAEQKKVADDLQLITTNHATMLAALHAAQGDADASEHDLNTKNVELAQLSAQKTAATPEQMAAKQKEVDAAAAHAQTARDNLQTLNAAHEYFTRIDKSAPSGEDTSAYLSQLGVPPPAAKKPAVPVDKNTPPLGTVLGLRAQIGQIDDQLRALSAAPAGGTDAKTSERSDLNNVRTLCSSALRNLQNTLQLQVDSSARKNDDWSKPALTPVPTPWLDKAPPLTTFDAMQVALNKADKTAGPKISGKPADAPPSYYDTVLNDDFAATQKPTPSADAKKAREDLEARANKPDDPKASANDKVFINAYRAVALHKAIDPQLARARLGHDSGWPNDKVSAFQDKQTALDKATADWYGQKPEVEAPPVLADVYSSQDPGRAKLAEAYFAAQDGADSARASGDAASSSGINAHREPEVQKAITARADARQTYAEAAKGLAKTDPPLSAAERQPLLAKQQKAMNDLDRANQKIAGADLRSGSPVKHFADPPNPHAFWETYAKVTNAIGKFSDKANFYDNAASMRKAAVAEADELWGKMENVMGSAKSELLHAIDRNAGAHQAVFQVLQQLVEDAAKGRG